MASKRKPSKPRRPPPAKAVAPAPAAPTALPVAPTQSATIGAPVAARGKVQKTFIQARILSGFTDAGHLSLLIGEYLETLEAVARQQAIAAADASRAFVATLPPFAPAGVVRQQIQSPHIDAIRADPLFTETFGQRPHQFALVDLTQLVALQPWIEPRGDVIPAADEERLAFALPNNWDVPAEISFFQPLGPIQILTSSPALQGLRAELDSQAGTVKLGAPKHLNLVQAVHLGGRHYLLNGYHRVADALLAGVTELPALVTEAVFGPQDVQLRGEGMFNIGHILGLPRPPLVADFHTAAAISSRVRERRYGVLIDLVVKPLLIGV
jgi:hypothetical protein